MQELITITEDEQGLLEVSARDLYNFLEVKKQFADWIKNRIDKYDFVEGRDYVTFSLIGEKGRPTIEYKLTVSAAKELAMVEGNAKGKEARLYFIEKEDQLRQTLIALATSAPPSSTTEQVLLQLVSQSNQILASQSELLLSLRADVDSIMAGHKPPKANRRPLPGKQLGLPGIPPGRPSASLRQLIHQRVVEYCDSWGYEQSQTYNYLYRRLNEEFGVNVYRLSRGKGESLLDAVERYGHLHRLYGLLMSELIYTGE